MDEDLAHLRAHLDASLNQIKTLEEQVTQLHIELRKDTICEQCIRRSDHEALIQPLADLIREEFDKLRVDIKKSQASVFERIYSSLKN